MRDQSYLSCGSVVNKRRGDGSSKVVRTLRELAEEVGADLKTVVATIANDKNAPQPEFKHSSSAARNSYYVRRDFHLWWRARTGAKEAKT